MKPGKIQLTAFAFLISFSVFAQDITGVWNGVLKFQGIELRIVLHVTKTENGYSSTMDSPDQGAKDIPVTSTVFINPKFSFSIAAAGIEYEGELKDQAITGIFKQGGAELPLLFTREKVTAKEIIRPQEPLKPYPYYSEEVRFKNPKANIELAGTLTLPKKEGKFPVVILISGSGPQNRDEELMGHKPFLVMSDHLTKNGIAVLRYDDRGTAASGGNFSTATSVDFAADVESAIAWLKTRKEIDVNRIGLIGHSEGGIIAPMVASGSRDVNFIILLAGTGVRGDKLLLAQQELIARVSGVDEAMINKSKEINKKIFDMVVSKPRGEELEKAIENYLVQVYKDDPNAAKPASITDEEFAKLQADQITSPWMHFFLNYDPSITLAKVKCPVLVLNGEKDLQVPATENLAAITAALKKAGNKHFTVKEFKGLNHLFQESQTGSPSEYASIEQTISPLVLQEITGWIKNLRK